MQIYSSINKEVDGQGGKKHTGRKSNVWRVSEMFIDTSQILMNISNMFVYVL